MSSVKFYALCTRNMHAVRRHAKYIPKEDLCIIINTLDDSFATEAKEYCIAEGIESHITRSDGTAATGKNTFLDTFAASSNEYAVLIDGDDFLTPHGVWTYKQLAQSANPPDIAAIEYQYGLLADTNYGGQVSDINPLSGVEPEDAYNPLLGSSDSTNPDKIKGWGFRCFLMDWNWWECAKQGRAIFQFHENDAFASDFSNTHKEWANHCYKYINNWETHCRLVWWSKAAAQNSLRFDPTYIVGEDTVLYFEYKHEHLQNNLVMKHLFDRWPTYVYDCRIDGVVAKERLSDARDRAWNRWLKKLNTKYNELESQGKMHEDVLPKVTVCTDRNAPDADLSSDIVWPEGYKPDILNLVSYPGSRVVKF